MNGLDKLYVYNSRFFFEFSFDYRKTLLYPTSQIFGVVGIPILSAVPVIRMSSIISRHKPHESNQNSCRDVCARFVLHVLHDKLCTFYTKT